MADVNRAQIRAARALLDWTQPDLATAANIGVATVKRFEFGRSQPVPVIKAAMVRALEDAGIDFHNDGKRASVGISVRRLPK